MAKTHSSLTGVDLHAPQGFSNEGTTVLWHVTQSVNKVNVSSSFLPTDNSSFDLGSDALSWNNIYLTGNIASTGNVSGSIISGSKLHVVGDTFIGGTLTLGDADTDTIKVVAEYSGSMIPDVDDAFDLGETGKEWKDLHIDGTANIDSLAVTDAFTYGSTTWNEDTGANSITGSDFIWKSTGGGFDVYDTSDALMFKIDNKVAVLGTVTGAAPTAVAGGIYYSGSDDFFFGYSSDPT